MTILKALEISRQLQSKEKSNLLPTEALHRNINYIRTFLLLANIFVVHLCALNVAHARETAKVSKVQFMTTFSYSFVALSLPGTLVSVSLLAVLLFLRPCCPLAFAHRPID
jgi:hypothetical protein